MADPTTDDVTALYDPMLASVRLGYALSKDKPNPRDWPSIRDAAYRVFDAWLAGRDAHIRAGAAAEALTKAADAWQQGAWINAPHRADPVAQRVANGQFVTDWLRARVERGESL